MSDGVKRILPSPLKKAGVWFFKEVIGGSVLRFPRPETTLGEPVSLHLLMSHATCTMGLLALKSFEWASQARWETFVHDDGTMDSQDFAAVRRVAPEASMITRSVADDRMSAFLINHPITAANRKNHPWFLKFLDCAAFAPHSDYIVLDTDVIFYSAPAEIMEWTRERPGSCHFMKDARETYCSPRDVILEKTGLNLWSAVNSGICLMPKSAVNLDLTERFLSLFEKEAKHYIFLEQTLFAVSGAAHGKGGTLPEIYEISWTMKRRRDSVARHYVGIIKHDLLYFEGATTLLIKRAFGGKG
jgi:hypothetical protein